MRNGVRYCKKTSRISVDVNLVEGKKALTNMRKKDIPHMSVKLLPIDVTGTLELTKVLYRPESNGLLTLTTSDKLDGLIEAHGLKPDYILKAFMELLKDQAP
ncbi:hypothetical protein J6590_020114 [Homalodisca vitripennis]|nr:hypothetical protein J6590_020114 [Homalodisca vitripennis]